MLLVQLPSGSLEYGLIATVRREKHDDAKPMPDEAPSDVERKVAESFGWHRERPRLLHVHLSAADPDGRREHSTEAVSDRLPDDVSEQRVASHWQVPPMTFDGAEWNDRRYDTALDHAAQLRTREFLQVHASGHASRKIPWTNGSLRSGLDRALPGFDQLGRQWFRRLSAEFTR